jgi:hypothetical protein
MAFFTLNNVSALSRSPPDREATGPTVFTRSFLKPFCEPRGQAADDPETNAAVLHPPKGRNYGRPAPALEVVDMRRAVETDARLDPPTPAQRDESIVDQGGVRLDSEREVDATPLGAVPGGQEDALKVMEAPEERFSAGQHECGLGEFQAG